MPLGDELYGDAASFGKFTALVGVIIGTLVGVVMLIIGSVLAIKHQEPYSEIQANILTSSCIQENENNENYYKCKITVEYEIKNIKYLPGDLFTHDIVQYDPVKNNKITLYYKESDPGHVYLSKQNLRTIGFVLLGIGLVLLVGCWIWFYVTRKFKFAAAAGGIGAAYNIIR